MNKPMLSRKWQVAINLLLIPVLLYGIYVFLGCPSFSLEQEYRRMEKANHVGPADILGTESVNGWGMPQIVLGDAGDHVILASIIRPKDRYFQASKMFSFPKTGDITVAAAPQDLHLSYGDKEHSLTLFIFDEYPQATHAKLDFELYWNGGSDPNYRKSYTLHAEREREGYFRMDLEFTQDKFREDPQFEAILQWNSVWNFPADWTPPEDAYPATVQLYDIEGNIVAEEKMQLIAQN